VSKHNWYKNGSGYISSTIKGKTVFLHRFLLNPEGFFEVDHKDGNKIDCKKNNLRICTNSQNQANKDIQKNNSSGYKGVTWHKQIKKWVARISCNRKRINLGSFQSIDKAIEAYNKASIELYGEYARVVRA